MRVIFFILFVIFSWFLNILLWCLIKLIFDCIFTLFYFKGIMIILFIRLYNYFNESMFMMLGSGIYGIIGEFYVMRFKVIEFF
jgi:hypothetical protein